MKVSDIYKEKKQVLSFEIFPPKKDDYLGDITETLDILSECKPDFISVTFGAGGSSNRNKTIEIAKLIKSRYGIEPIVHLTCLCYDKDEIREFVRVLQQEGLENILALRGDHNPNITEKDVFPHASDLIAYIREISGDYFCIAAACYPENHPESSGRLEEIRSLRAKYEAGADLFLSQLFFDNDGFMAFEEDCRIADINVPVTPGIMPVTKATQIKRMVEMCGATLPARFSRIIDRYADNEAGLFDAGMSYALSQVIDLLASGSDGIHLYTMNNPVIARRISVGIKNIV